MLRAIGYWIEEWRPPDTDGWRANPEVILSTLGAQAPSLELVSYLRNGHELERWRGWSWCRFRCGIDDSLMGHSDLTDGTWVWPEGLAHYVEVHQLTLPKEFVEIALANGGVVPALADHVRALSHAQRMDSVDPTFWNDWYRRVAGEAD